MAGLDVGDGGAEPNAAGPGRDHRQRGVDVAPEELRVGEPHRVEPEVLGATRGRRDLVGSPARRKARLDLHARRPPQLSRSCESRSIEMAAMRMMPVTTSCQKAETPMSPRPLRNTPMNRTPTTCLLYTS